MLFIGNSRGVFRESVKYAVDTDYDFAVYGNQWEGFESVENYVKDSYLANEEVGQAYHDACILLNDHWDDMREEGIVSNRVFDALAAETLILSDYMPEIDEIFQGCVPTYKNEEEFRKKVQYYMEHEEERKRMAKKGRNLVLEKHTFKDRVQVMIEDMKTL